MSAGTERCRAGYSRNLARFVMIALENVEKCWIAVPLACRARTQVEKIDIPYSASLPALGASADTPSPFNIGGLPQPKPARANGGGGRGARIQASPQTQRIKRLSGLGPGQVTEPAPRPAV